ncbi:nuatigenin 3-beta-glucosyltransferase-like isoform X1 [Actinidia eriantha]|uniref:nuatigenin 3-beta-glucosyltransferase-like isoform X1 n=1 Tax=Actinidia eriantha TaxID=165200 RepID=UPI002585F3AF|nr:nuatigenin 3-beta-glucosyltransferase-like isoform X1 [Actinidia eriantha]
MEKVDRKLNIFFLPHFSTSHLIPMVDTARLFVAHGGVAATIVTTPHNARLFQGSLDCDSESGGDIKVHTVKMPSAEVGLPQGIENIGQCSTPRLIGQLFKAIALLQKPIEQLIRENRPDCIVSDMFFPWSVEIAEEINAPRILFYPSNAFYHSVSHSLNLHAPHDKVQSDTETFLIPYLPDQIEMTRSQLQDHLKTKTQYGQLINMIKDTELRSYGIIFTSFQGLEPAYVDHFKKVRGIRSWHLGLPSHFIDRNKYLKEKNSVVTEQHGVLSWLETQKPNSVLYICFGSMIRFPDAQFSEIALALEASGHPFVWVVRKEGKAEEIGVENWLPEGFEEKVKENNSGMVIRGWAPQVRILNHPAIGGFVTHCGWNSVLESIVAGVPLITWPMFAEQFYNENLITRILNIGVEVGSGVWNPGFEIMSPVVGSDKILKAVNRLMGGSGEAKEIRRRAKELAEMADRSVEEGGSTFTDLKALIEEIKEVVFQKD